MHAPFLEIIRRHCRPLEPVPTETPPRLRALPDIRCVLFDVYGTLMISGCGEVGTAAPASSTAALAAAGEAVGLSLLTPDRHADPTAWPRVAELLRESIAEAHRNARKEGVEYPEVDIVAIWRQTLQRLQDEGRLGGTEDLDLEQLAVEYEVRANPTWPMPGAAACLAALAARPLQLGIVSNAQFFTPLLFPALWQQSVETLGFDPELQFYSFQSGQAKPGRALYNRAAWILSTRGLRPHNVLLIGNDMLNDVAVAQQVGFRAAWFAGDARSLRPRSDDPRVAGVTPDLIVTHLCQVPDCLL